ncbi:unnamed protein product [Adineta ricciae]|uniref:Uncharacterized protein n=1 Tax=Adineta ricciae TaxID=249248 RepID=A0A814XTP8_ADIRI|nr:unnamed protein product [Adineta ricciae]CAF1613089.1 unnamed protein product [Adineta ricciae]
MTTATSPIIREKPLINLKSICKNASLKSTSQSVLPNYPLVRKRHTKKRVRFELKLESVQEETSSIVNKESPIAEPTTRFVNSWHDNKLLRNAYIKALDKANTPKRILSEAKRPSRPSLSPLPDEGNPLYSRSFVVDLSSTTTSSFYLPNISQRRALTPKKFLSVERQHSATFFDSSLKQRLHSATSPRRSVNPIGDRKFFSPIVKRIDLALPSIKDLNPNERLIRIDNCSQLKLIHDSTQAKKHP